MKKKFTPEDLKRRYPRKCDEWIFYQTGKGYWIGRPKKGGGIKKIGVKYDEKGKATSCLVDTKLDSTGSWGLQVFTRSLKTFLKKKS